MWCCIYYLNPGPQRSISMDGKGCYRDNIFVKRLWRNLKNECVYLKAFKDERELHQALTRYFHWFDQERPHQGLDYQTPDVTIQGYFPLMFRQRTL